MPETQPEPLSAILAEMRDERIIHIEDADTTRCLLRNLADRIEAAAAREHEEAKNYFAKLHDGPSMICTAKNCALRNVGLAIANAAPGNAAAMRAALEDAHRLIEAFLVTVGDRGMRSEFVEMRHRIRAALAAPARNCDRFADPGKAWLAYKAECDRDETVPNMIGAIAWLLAPAKGGAE